MNEKYLIEINELSKLIHIDENQIINTMNEFNIQSVKKDNKLYCDSRDINELIINKKMKYNFSSINKKFSESIANNARQYKKNGFKVIDLFCGAGGSSCGFKMAGFDVVGAIDVNKIAAATHEINFPNNYTVCGDIQEFTPDKMELKTGKDIDVIIGSPPCQTFSSLSHGKINSLGRDIKDDIRNFYYKSFIDYVVHFSPKIFVMENVPGFKTKYKGKIFNDLVTFFESYNNGEYIIKDALLQSEDYGVPQTRKRLFVVGYKRKYKFDFPEPTHSNGLLGKDFISVEEAIGDLPNIDDNWRIDEMPYSNYDNLCEYQQMMRGNLSTVKNNICRISNEKAKEMFLQLSPGQRYIELPKVVREELEFEKSFNSKIIAGRCRKLPIHEPAWTIIAHIGMDGYEYIHPKEVRTLSVREAARIQSFPDDFVFLGNMREQYVQIGNAVPPLLAYAIAKEVEKTLINKK